MITFFFISASGWFASSLICVAIAIPYLTRRHWFNGTLDSQGASNSPS